jgi:uncharacterized membrane protein YbaN (DUF454 family)
MLRILLIIVGFFSVSLGLIGIVLPVLPTTPFLLLASFLFYKSSPYLQSRLLNHKYLGNYIRNFQQYKAIPIKVKISSLLLLWVCILSSAFIFISLLWLRILLIGIAIAVSIHILSYKTLNKK